MRTYRSARLESIPSSCSLMTSIKSTNNSVTLGNKTLLFLTDSVFQCCGFLFKETKKKRQTVIYFFWNKVTCIRTKHKHSGSAVPVRSFLWRPDTSLLLICLDHWGVWLSLCVSLVDMWKWGSEWFVYVCVPLFGYICEDQKIECYYTVWDQLSLIGTKCLFPWVWRHFDFLNVVLMSGLLLGIIVNNSL